MAIGLLWLISLSVAPRGEAQVSFVRDVAPILVTKCQACHGAEKAKGGYRLDTFERLLRAGDSATLPIHAGQPAASGVFGRLTTDDADDRMPQDDDPLAPEAVQLIERWIREGAVFDGTNVQARVDSLIPRPAFPKPPEVYPRALPVTALAFSPDGTRLASSGYHEVLLWHAGQQPRLEQRIGDLPERIQALAWSLDGRQLGVAGGSPGRQGYAGWIEPLGERRAAALPVTSDLALALTWSPDGRRLATAGTDGIVRLFEVADQRVVATISQHADWVTAIAYSPGGDRLLSAGRDRMIRVADAASGELDVSYVEHSAAVSALAVATNGIVCSGGRDRKLHFWNLADAKKQGEAGPFDGDVLRLVVHGGIVVAATSAGEVIEFGTADRKRLRRLEGPGDAVHALTIHGPSGRVAAGTHDGWVFVWDASATEPSLRFRAAPGFHTQR